MYEPSKYEPSKYEPSKSVAGQEDLDVAYLCRHFAELSPQPMVAVEGTTHSVRYFNAAFARLAGKTRADLIGRPFAEAVPEGEDNGCLALLDRVYNTGTPEILEEQQHSQTSPIYWTYSVWPVLGADERPLGVMIEITDATEVAIFRNQVVAMNGQLLLAVTRQHELTERAERANRSTEIAEKASAAKDEFLSRMSHELRTPLNAILGFGQILEMREEQLTPADSESVQYILKAGRHLLDLVNEVLDLTRLQTPGAVLSLEPVALDEVVREAVDMLQPLAARADIRMTQQLAAAPAIFVLADRQRLLQILLNLLSNAINYNKPGGLITVSAEVLPEKRARFHVNDTGHGIAAEDLSKLFVPFSRLNAEKMGIKGTGLGLVLCQRLAKAMNGSLHVESHPEIGSTFSVELPLAECPALPSAHPSAQLPVPVPHANAIALPAAAATATATPARHTVLLIEDNVSNLRLIEVIFKGSDVRLVAAMQGGLGVELARHERPDLILLDLHLPDIMGDEVLRRLQTYPETQDIPVIMLSADATPAQVTRLLNQGARHYLTKPLNIKEFLQVVHDFLQVVHETI